MKEQNFDVCPLHTDMKEDVDRLFEKIGKLNDKLFWIMLLIALNLFFSGANMMKEIFLMCLKH